MTEAGERVHRGLAWERAEMRRLAALGCDVVPARIPNGPCDGTVNGFRVDVKSAEWTEYAQRRGFVRGHVFTDLKRGEDCDVFILICHRGSGVAARFVVPAADAGVKTLTITPLALRGGGKWGRFLEAWDALKLRTDSAQTFTKPNAPGAI